MPEVFISYRQTDHTQRKRARDFGKRIREQGIRVILDQFYLDEKPGGPDVGWPKWCSDQALHTGRVLVIGSEAWFRCFDMTEKPGVGLGAACEAHELRDRLYRNAGLNEDIRVVLFDVEDAKYISLSLQRYHHFHAEQDFENIVRWLKPPPGGLCTISAPSPAPKGTPSQPRNIPDLSLGDLFKGRDDLLKELHEALHGGARAASINAAPAIAATHGLGGIGKTRLAIEYGWLHAGDYDALLFISGETKEKLETTFAALTGELVLDLPERKLADPAAQKAAVIKWLREHPRYFLIIDNIDDGEALKAAHALIDELPGGHIICTGRISNWPVDFQSIEISVLKAEDARDYLLSAARSRIPEPNDAKRAEEIAGELGGLALALEQAAAYINVQRITFTRYLQVWQKQHEKVMKAFEEQSSEYPRTFITTWQTSFEKLKPGAAHLLELLAWFAPDPIPDALLEEKATIVMNKIHPPAVDADALADLFRYNLATRESAEPLFSIHRLVQDVMRRRLEKEGRAAALRERAIEWTYHAFSGDAISVSEWSRFDPLAPHGLALAALAASHSLQRLAGSLYFELRAWNHSHGRYGKAVELSRLAVQHLQAALGPGHPDTLGARNNLGESLRLDGRYPEAVAEHQAVLTLRQRLLGLEHPHTLTSRNNLVAALGEQGKYAEAESECRAVLEIQERTLGMENPETLTSRNNLGVILQSHGKYAEAAIEHRAVIEGRQRALGPEHPSTLTSRTNLASLLQLEGKYVEAETESRTVLEIQQRILGSEHPDTLASRHNLALALSCQGKLAEAVEENRAVLEIRQHVLGSDHPDIFQTCFNLSLCLEAQDKKLEALEFARRALEGWRKTFGDSRRETLDAHTLVARLEKAA